MSAADSVSAPTLVDFLRHGEPHGGRRFRGHGVDDALSERGWQQMWEAVGDPVPWDTIVTSPLQRCQAFAEALAERHGLPVHVDARFREVGFGVWEGRSPTQIQTETPEDYAAFYRDPVSRRPQGAEPLADFAARVSEAFDELLTRFAGRTILVVAHAGVVRAALGRVMEAQPAAWYRASVDNAGLTRFRLSEDILRLDFHNRKRL